MISATKLTHCCSPSILEGLVSSHHNYKVTVLSRQESNYQLPKHINATLKKVNYSDHAALVETLKGQDAVVSTIASFSTGDQVGIIDAAIKAGVKRFIPAEFGVDTTRTDVLERVPFLKGKAQVRNYLEQKNKETGFEWTEIITGPFFDWYGFFLRPQFRKKPETNANAHML